MKTLLLLLPLRPLSSQGNQWQRSLLTSQVLHQLCPHGQVPQQCPHGQNLQSPHGQFLMLLLFLQNPQLLPQSAAPATSSALVHLATCQRTTGISIASGASASSSAAPKSSSGPTLLKTKATAGRGPRPSPKKKHVAFQVPSDDEADDDELAEIIRDRQERPLEPKAHWCHCFWIHG